MKRLPKWAAISIGGLFVLLIVIGILTGDPEDAETPPAAAGETPLATPTATPTATPKGPTYIGGQLACPHFRNILNDVSQGFLTDIELRGKLKEVQGSASTAEPKIRDAASRMLGAITQGQYDALVEAAKDMASACNQYGY